MRIEGTWYFPPSTLVESMFTRSEKTYQCSWKGEATYWDVGRDDDTLADGAWSFPDPIKDSFDRVGLDFTDYVAFDERITFEDEPTV